MRSCGDAVGYARALATLARQHLAAPALTMGATGGALLHRVQRLLGTPSPELGPSRLPSAVALALVAGCVVLNLDWLQAFSEQQAIKKPQFEVASVKPHKGPAGQVSVGFRGNSYTASGVSLAMLVRIA